jgi:DNA-binding CsgD family transcriptional regulator
LRRTTEAATAAARDSGDIELQLGALFRQFLTRLTLGELSAARTTAQAFDALTRRYPLPYHRWYASLWNGLLALAAGKVARAQAFVDEIEPEATTQRELAALNRDTLQAEIWNAQGGDLRVRAVGELRDAVDREIGLGWVFAPRLAALTEGRESALALLRPAMRRFGTLEIDEDWLPIASELAAAAVSCGAPEESAEMFQILLPHAQRWIVIANGASCRGPVSSFLAALARVAGMTTEAEAFRADAKTAIEREQAPGLAFWMDLAPVGADPPPRKPGGLTVREAEVLALVARGHSNQEIADALFLSVRTVQRHVENIYGRLGLHNRAGAALAAVELGLVSPGDIRTGERG